MFTIENHLEIENGQLTIGGLSAPELVEEYGSPLFVTNEERIRENFRRYRSAFPDSDLYYAAKANGNITILKILAEEGAGADVFSDGELYLALLAGISRKKILFNGNSKTDLELEMAVRAGVRVSVDSADELEALSEIAVKAGEVAEIAFRVNPDVSPETHPKISTGLRTSKFGIPYEDVGAVYKRALELPGVLPLGIHFHIGSQILDISPFAGAVQRMMDLVDAVTKLGVELEFVDIGSGLGIPYRKEPSPDYPEKIPSPQDLADLVLPVFNERCAEIGISPKLVLEPGRYLVADSTVLLTKVNTVKEASKMFVGVDAGFNLLLRPAMYDSYHFVLVANKADLPPAGTYTVVGPICESGDVLAKDRELPEVEKGDTIAIFDAGAYGFSMSSRYNGRPLAAEVLVNRGEAELIRRREDYSDLLANQVIPSRFL